MSDFHRRLEEQIPRLRRYARALTRDASRADDLVQDTLLRALAKQHLWQEGTNLRAWLFTLMHNQHVNDVRRSNRDGGNIDVTEMASVLVANTDPTASRQLRELERGLALLPLEQREAILLVGLEGMRYDEAAAIAGVPIGTVRSRLSRGREALRRILDIEDEAAPAGAARAQRGERACRGRLILVTRRPGNSRQPIVRAAAIELVALPGPPVPPRGCMSAAPRLPVVIPREATHSESVRRAPPSRVATIRDQSCCIPGPPCHRMMRPLSPSSPRCHSVRSDAMCGEPPRASRRGTEAESTMDTGPDANSWCNDAAPTGEFSARVHGGAAMATSRGIGEGSWIPAGPLGRSSQAGVPRPGLRQHPRDDRRDAAGAHPPARGRSPGSRPTCSANASSSTRSPRSRTASAWR